MVAIELEHRARRKGSITPFLLVSLMALLAAFAVAVDYIFLWQTRVEMQVANDAAALAGTQSFIDDDFLTGDPAKIQQRVEEGRTNALLYASLNRVLARPAQLDSNPANLPDGDIVLGTLDHPGAKFFIPAQDTLDPFNVALSQVNAVHVVSPRTQARGNSVFIPLGALVLRPSVDVISASTAMIDRAVIGFRFTNSQPLPLAPIALQSDPNAVNPLSWEFVVQARRGPDLFRFDRTTNTFVADPLGDGIHEFLATLSLPGNNPTPGTNAVILNFGAGTPAATAGQIRTGLTPPDLQNQGGELLLGPTNTVLLPGSPATPASGSPGFVALQQSLMHLQMTAEQRIWPLYRQSSFQTGVTTVSGFVAARVVQVNAVPGGPLTFILQATMLATPDAVTDFTRRGVGGVNITNPYVVKIRLVQ
jgi:hypothetical protein